MSQMKAEFLERMRGELGADFAAFESAMLAAPSVSVKLNRRKAQDVEVLGYGRLEPVVWCDSGYYLDERPNFTLNPLLHAGVFYVQDASSMVYESLVRDLVAQGMLANDSLVLDLCAAPGGKTTSIINSLPDGAVVVANEFVPQRAAVLRENLLKWGYPHVLATNSPTSQFGDAGPLFSLVAVDAPCSGEGMMRKDPKAVEQWSPRLVEQCAALQREILADAVAALKPGGHLIYSTCTFSRAENEDNTDWLSAELGLELVQSRRFMPHLTRGEGLYVALLRKPGDEVSTAPRRKVLDLLRKRTKVVLDGIPQSTAKGKVEIPASEAVLSTDYAHGRFAEAELDLETALRYLRHESIVLPGNIARGYVVVTYKGYPLGLVKNIGNRANNLYPSGWRIRMDIK